MGGWNILKVNHNPSLLLTVIFIQCSPEVTLEKIPLDTSVLSKNISDCQRKERGQEGVVWF